MRSADPAHGRFPRADRRRDRLRHHPSARGGLRGDHALQLPRHGAHVDVSHRHRLREHLRAQAFRESAPDGHPARGTAPGGRPAARGDEPGPRRRGRGERYVHAPGYRRRLLCRIVSRGQARLPDRDRPWQARAVGRRRQELHDHPARRGSRVHGGRPDRLGIRMRRGAVHGRQRGRGRGGGRRARAAPAAGSAE